MLRIEQEYEVQNLDQLQALISAGADVNAHLPTSLTPLGFAAKQGLSEQCWALLQAGADPNRGDLFAQRSPLYLAVHKRLQRGVTDVQLADVCKALTAHGAGPNGIPSDCARRLMTSYLPLFEACTAADAVAIDLLAAAGADFERIGITLRRGKASLVGTFLCIAREVNNQDVVAQLLRLGASDISPANEGKTPFQISVLNGFSKLVEYYVRVRGESLDQLINGKKLEDAARSMPTRELILALKTELAIHGALGSHELAREATPRTRAAGMVL